MRDNLLKILYGDIYEASPGSDRYREQCRRIQEATALIIAREEEMAKKKPPKKPESDIEERPSSFRDKMVTKFEEEIPDGI